jgi:hypothetical protein
MCRSSHSHPLDHAAVSVKTTNLETSQCVGRLRLKCDGTRGETRFRLSAKRTSPFKSAGASVQSTTGSRGVRISGSNAGYTMFRGSVKVAGYPLHSPVSPSLPLPCVTVCHHISTGLYSHFSTYSVTFFLLSSLSSDTLSLLLGWETKFYTRIKRVKF